MHASLRLVFRLTLLASLACAFAASAQVRAVGAKDLPDEELLSAHTTLDGTPVTLRVRYDGRVRYQDQAIVTSKLGVKDATPQTLDEVEARLPLPIGADLDFNSGAALAGTLAVQAGASPDAVNKALALAIPNFVAMQLRSKRSEVSPYVAPAPVNPEVVQAALGVALSTLQLGKAVAGRQSFTKGFNTAVAALRMVRGDYCGDGNTHTTNGNPIDVYDLVSPGPNTSTVMEILAKAGVPADAAKTLAVQGGVVVFTPNGATSVTRKLSREEAEAIKAQLVEAGATVEVK